MSEVDLGIDARRLQVEVRLERMVAVRPPRALPTNSEFLRLSTTRFISRSPALLSMGTAPSARNTFNSGHWFRAEPTASPPAASWRAQQRCFDRFLAEYNQERPHAALGGATSAERYRRSGREFPARLAEIEYPSGMEVRRVSPGGQLRIWRHHPFVSNVLVGQPVGLEPVGEGQWRAWFSFYELGVYDVGRGKMWTPAQWRRFCRKGNAAPA